MKTRIGASIIFYNGVCYQSNSWKIFRPLGSLYNAIKILDEYEVDEINILRPIRNKKDKHYLSDCSIISKIYSNTPISFGGGIRSISKLKPLRSMPIERIILNSSFISRNIKLLKKIKQDYGRQSIVCCLPLKFLNNVLNVYCSSTDSFRILKKNFIKEINNYINEYLIIDVDNEGVEDSFNFNLIKDLNIEKKKIIISGGVGKQVINIANKNNLAAVIIENRYFYKELNNFKF